jgi:guanylate kinase
VIKGKLFTVSAPSGAGKTSLVKALIDSTDTLIVSVSHTTRAPRPGEVDGEHYYFIDEQAFQAMASRGEFLEHAQVFGNRYGTAEAVVEDRLNAGFDVLLEIDWQGADQVRQRMPGSQSIFILPPSRAALLARLQGRGQDDPGVIDKRMQAAVEEMAHYAASDYLVFNDDFDTALADLRAVVHVGRLATPRQAARYRELLASLLA